MKIKIICQYNIIKRNNLERKTTKFEIFLTNHILCKSLMKRTPYQGVSMFKTFTLFAYLKRERIIYANKKIKYIYWRSALNRNVIFIDQFSYSKYNVL